MPFDLLRLPFLRSLEQVQRLAELALADGTFLLASHVDQLRGPLGRSGIRRVERESRAAHAAGRPYPPGHDSRPVRVAVYSERRKTLDQLGHFLYLRFGDDAISQFWGRWRNSELDKFRSSRVRFWRCAQCPTRHDDGARAAGGREVEFPETRCYGRHLVVEISAEHAPPGMHLADGQASFSVTVSEEDARRVGELGFLQGTVWTVGMPIETRVRSPLTGGFGPWVGGRLSNFRKCGARMPDAAPWEARRRRGTCCRRTPRTRSPTPTTRTSPRCRGRPTTGPARTATRSPSGTAADPDDGRRPTPRAAAAPRAATATTATPSAGVGGAATRNRTSIVIVPPLDATVHGSRGTRT